MTITNEDNMQLMARYPDKYFDLAIVDPPYGLGMGGSLNVNSKVNYENKTWDTEIPSNEYFDELKRISKNQIVWGGNYFGYLWQVGCKGFICWNKLNHHDNRADVEMAWTSFNKLAKYVEYMWDGNRYGTKGNIKGVGKPTIRIHPTEKPIFLYEWLLINYAKEGDKILDTHLGSGSIAIACHNLGFELTACELDKDYYEAAMKRLEQHKQQLTIF
jgi:site-specific DNA-methyltransferase (adenine-specific)